MTAQSGAAFLLKIGDGAATPIFSTVAGLRTTQLSIAGDPVTITSKDSGGWRELLSGAGTRSVSVAGAGVFTGSAAEARLKGNALSGVLDSYELSFEGGERMRGRFLLTKLDYSGDFQWRASLHAGAGILRRGAELVSRDANPARGEVALAVAGRALTVRPSFAALVAAEAELGPLFALVERAAAGALTLAESAALIWHCLRDAPADLPRDALNEALADGGLAALTPVLRALLAQILQGR